jgi:hypothetical protein
MNTILLFTVLLIGLLIGYYTGRAKGKGRPIITPPPNGSMFYVKYILGNSYLAVFPDGKVFFYHAVNYLAPSTTGFYRMGLKEERFDFCSFPDNVQYTPELSLMDQSLFKRKSPSTT